MRDIGVKGAKAQLERLRGIKDMNSLILMVQELNLPIDYADIEEPVRLRQFIRNHLTIYIIEAQDRSLRQSLWVRLRWLTLVFILGAGIGIVNYHFLVYQSLQEKHERVRKTLEEKEATIEKLTAAKEDTVKKLQAEIELLKSQRMLFSPTTPTIVSPHRPSPWSRWRRYQPPPDTLSEPVPED